jgi:hypothetical protein
MFPTKVLSFFANGLRNFAWRPLDIFACISAHIGRIFLQIMYNTYIRTEHFTFGCDRSVIKGTIYEDCGPR